MARRYRGNMNAEQYLGNRNKNATLGAWPHALLPTGLIRGPGGMASPYAEEGVFVCLGPVKNQVRAPTDAASAVRR
jgi:hypothetical protein